MATTPLQKDNDDSEETSPSTARRALAQVLLLPRLPEVWLTTILAGYTSTMDRNNVTHLRRLLFKCLFTRRNNTVPLPFVLNLQTSLTCVLVTNQIWVICGLFGMVLIYRSHNNFFPIRRRSIRRSSLALYLVLQRILPQEANNSIISMDYNSYIILCHEHFE
jgi:hypothetical protein